MTRSYANTTLYPWDRARNRLPNATISGNATKYYNDIEQQLLGDCYYLSGLAAIGEVSSRISNAILTPNYTKSGIFAA